MQANAAIPVALYLSRLDWIKSTVIRKISMSRMPVFAELIKIVNGLQLILWHIYNNAMNARYRRHSPASPHDEVFRVYPSKRGFLR